MPDVSNETLAQYVEQVLGWFHEAPKSEQVRFINTRRHNLITYHHTLGRSIRNNLKLWENRWHPKVQNGVDRSPDHPDALSMTIIELV